MNKSHPKLGEVPQPRPAAGERIDSWKEIARYLNREVRTVQRWEEADGLPIYRLKQDRTKRSPVYAYKSEIDAWLRKNPPPQTDPVGARKRRRLWLALPAVAVFAAVAFVLWLRQKPAQQMAEVDPTHIAVAAFENRTGDKSLENLGLQIADSIRSTFLQVRQVKVADSPSGSATMDHRRLAEVTRSGMVVTGTYYLRNGQGELYAQVTDPLVEKDPLYSFGPIPGSATDPTKAIERVCQLVTGAIAFRAEDTKGRLTPPSLDAYREYRLGNLSWGANDNEAYRRYGNALSIDPGFWMARFKLFFALADRGKFELMETQLAQLEEGSGRMAPLERAMVRYCRDTLEGRLLDMVTVAREQAAIAPEFFFLQLGKGTAETSVNQPLAAIKTFETIPVGWATKSLGHGAWPSQFLAEAYHLAGDFKGQLRIATERLVQFPDELALFSHQSMAWAALGQLEEVTRVIDACLAVTARSTSRSADPATVMEDAAYELRAHGYRKDALELGKREIEWLESRPQRDSDGWRYQLGRAYYLTEQWQNALEIFKELAGKNPQNIEFQGYLGALAARLGDSAGAERVAEALGALDGRYKYGLHTYWRAHIASLLDEKEKSVRLLGEAFAQGYRFNIAIHRDPDFEPLHAYPPYQELTRPKG